MKSPRARRSAALCSWLLVLLAWSQAFGQRPFTAKDDVGLELFEYAGRRAPLGVIKYSPDTKYFTVVTERGRLNLNAPEDTVWVFRTEDVQDFVQHPNNVPPAPLPLVQLTSDKDGPLIEPQWPPKSGQ